MKITALVGVALLAGGIAAASADQAPQKGTSKKPARVTLKTSSKTPRTVALNGRVTDGTYPLVVVTAESIRRSGASTLSQTLMRFGGP